MRRSVLGAAMRGGEPSDADLLDALESLLTARSALTRKLLGTRGDEDDGAGAGADGIEPEDVVDFAFVAGQGEPGFPILVPAEALDALDDDDDDEDQDQDDSSTR